MCVGGGGGWVSSSISGIPLQAAVWVSHKKRREKKGKIIKRKKKIRKVCNYLLKDLCYHKLHVIKLKKLMLLQHQILIDNKHLFSNRALDYRGNIYRSSSSLAIIVTKEESRWYTYFDTFRYYNITFISIITTPFCNRFQGFIICFEQFEFELSIVHMLWTLFSWFREIDGLQMTSQAPVLAPVAPLRKAHYCFHGRQGGGARPAENGRQGEGASHATW